jgi:hypothetical protein
VHACCREAALEHPSKEADVSGNAFRYFEQQRLFPRQACLHKSVIILYTQHLQKFVYNVESVWAGVDFPAMTATPETTYGYTIKSRAFRRDYIERR